MSSGKDPLNVSRETQAAEQDDLLRGPVAIAPSRGEQAPRARSRTSARSVGIRARDTVEVSSRTRAWAAVPHGRGSGQPPAPVGAARSRRSAIDRPISPPGLEPRPRTGLGPRVLVSVWPSSDVSPGSCFAAPRPGTPIPTGLPRVAPQWAPSDELCRRSGRTAGKARLGALVNQTRGSTRASWCSAVSPEPGGASAIRLCSIREERAHGGRRCSSGLRWR